MTKPSVLFAYGASAGSGGIHSQRIAQHLGVRDALVETPDLSFPEAHSAYFALDGTSVHIAKALG